MAAPPMLGMISNKVAKAKNIKIGVRGTTVQKSKLAPFSAKGAVDQGAGKTKGPADTTGKTIDKNQGGGRMSKGGSAGAEGGVKTDGAAKFPAGATVKGRKQRLSNKNAKVQPSGPLYGGPSGRP